MKILFTGGGTGGHFYPIIAVAEEIKKICLAEKLVEPKLYFASDDAYNPKALFEHNITFVSIPAGKRRTYRSLLNFLDWFKTAWGVAVALVKIFLIFPDVIFGKGGYASFPTLLAARIFGIPVIIHDSDSVPGRVNLWAGRFARRIALSYPDAVQYFPADKTAVTGNPIRTGIQNPIKTGAFEYLHLDPAVPVVFVVGGSSGAVRINDAILAILPQMLNKYQLIHQVGAGNLADCQERSGVILRDHPHRDRYKIFAYLNDTALRMTAGAASLVVSRAGSAIFEIAGWSLPSIIIPIPEEISRDQTTNAFTYARSGSAVVIEEENLTPSVLWSEIDRLMSDDALRQKMSTAAAKFYNPAAGATIAKALLDFALAHES